jgi:hypothetical protein
VPPAAAYFPALVSFASAALIRRWAVAGVQAGRQATPEGPQGLDTSRSQRSLSRLEAKTLTLANRTAGPGYEGAGIGIRIPARQPPGGRELDISTRTRNAIQRSLRCLGERGFALLTGRWRTLRHITASPSKIGDIARAALVLTHFEHGYITGGFIIRRARRFPGWQGQC